MWYERGRRISLNLHRHRTSHWADEERRVGATGMETAFLNKYVLIGRRQHTVWSPEDRFHRGLEKWLSWWSACLAHTALTWISITCHGAGYNQLHTSRKQWKVLSDCKTEVIWNRGSRKEGRRGKRKELRVQECYGALSFGLFQASKTNWQTEYLFSLRRITFDSEMSPQARVCVLHPQLMVLLGGCGTYRSRSLTAETGNIWKLESSCCPNLVLCFLVHHNGRTQPSCHWHHLLSVLKSQNKLSFLR